MSSNRIRPRLTLPPGVKHRGGPHRNLTRETGRESIAQDSVKSALDEAETELVRKDRRIEFLADHIEELSTNPVIVFVPDFDCE